MLKQKTTIPAPVSVQKKAPTRAMFQRRGLPEARHDSLGGARSSSVEQAHEETNPYSDIPKKRKRGTASIKAAAGRDFSRIPTSTRVIRNTSTLATSSSSAPQKLVAPNSSLSAKITAAKPGRVPQRMRAINAPGSLTEISESGYSHEAEADRMAHEVVQRMNRGNPDPPSQNGRAEQGAAATLPGLGSGRPLSMGVRQRFEQAFNWSFSGVRLHQGFAATKAAMRLGARAFTLGRNIVFGESVSNPEVAQQKLMAHELTHVVQQDLGAGASASGSSVALASSPAQAQAAPLVTAVNTSATELGVGGRDITATATVAGRHRLTWTINPGGVVPAGVSIVGRGRRVLIRSRHPPGGAVVGGTPIVIRAALTSSTTPDGANSAAVTLVQVVSANYTAAPALAAVPALIPGAPPANSAEPNRDGISGNTAVVNAVTAPAGRAVNVSFRRSLGASLSGLTITPGRRTGDLRLRIRDPATRARLDETLPATAGPAANMAELTVNAVPTRVTSLTRASPQGPYGVQNTIGYASSDRRHPPLTRIVGELVTAHQDQLDLGAPNAGYNPGFLLNLAVPANSWNDNCIRGTGLLNQTDGRIAIDVNRFVGPGVPQLPQRHSIRQQFVYASWQGAGAVVSDVISRGGIQRFSLVRRGGNFRFFTEQILDGARAPLMNQAYGGPPLINLTNVVANPTAPGATDLAADGVATANLGVTSSVPGRTVDWTIRRGDFVIAAGSPAVLPATATLRAGLRSGTFVVRAADSIYPNRRVNGRVRVAPVLIRRMRATPRTLATGVNTTTVRIDARPGGRTVNWTVDAAALAAGVTVTPASTGPGGPAMSATVTRPATFTGVVTVTATDSVLAARRRALRIRMR